MTAQMTFQDGKLQDIHHQTLLDPQLVKLARVIQNGWGESRRELDADLHAFWIHRFNMHIANGIIMNGLRIIVPKSLQQEYLQCLHVGHLGISKCRARAKITVFWPNIDRVISQLINVMFVMKISMPLQVTVNILLKLIFQVIFMGLIFVH